MLAKGDDSSLNSKGWVGDKPCFVTIDTREAMTLARPEIATSLPERRLSQPHILQMASGETLPILKELTLG
jgi:hypothetical protein